MLVVVGVVGLCLVGSCLSLGLLAAVSEDSTTPSNEVTPPAADDEGPSTGTRYQCMATGMVNKCVAPGRCTFMTVSGVGSGWRASRVRNRRLRWVALRPAWSPALRTDSAR